MPVRALFQKNLHWQCGATGTQVWCWCQQLFLETDSLEAQGELPRAAL